MTNTEIIAKIRAEIERLKSQLVRDSFVAQIETGNNCKEEAYNEMLSFLSDLEKSLPAKVTDGEELEKEIERYFPESAFDTGWNYDDMQEVAHHFYELGCRRTAEKADEIEYNRQIADEQNFKELEKEIYDYCPDSFEGFSFDNAVDLASHFAEWGTEHLKK